MSEDRFKLQEAKDLITKKVESAGFFTKPDSNPYKIRILNGKNNVVGSIFLAAAIFAQPRERAAAYISALTKSAVDGAKGEPINKA